MGFRLNDMGGAGSGGGGSTPSTLQILTADPPAPADNTAWLLRTGPGPTDIDWRLRVNGVTTTIPIGTVP